MLSVAVSGDLCELDMDVSGVDSVVSGADTDRMSRRDIVMSVDDMSL